MRSVLLKSLAEVELLSQELVATLSKKEQAHVWALSGDLGAGKTTFAQAVARILGVKETVTSPTFVIEKVYPLEHPFFTRLVHLDCYRLNGRAELEPLGWDNLITDPGHLILIEWPERVDDLVVPTLKLDFKFIDETTREVTIYD